MYLYGMVWYAMVCHDNSNKTGYLSTTVQYYSTILTGIMCLHALLCVYMQLTNTNVKELEVEERIKKDLLIL